MSMLIELVRIALSAFLLAAAVLKVAAPRDLVAAAARLGVPRIWLLGRRGRSLRPAVIGIELVLAVGLLLPATARTAAAVATTMLVGFAGLLAGGVRRGETGDCGCFGATGRIGWPAVVRTALAGGAALAIALVGVEEPPGVHVVVAVSATLAVALASVAIVLVRARFRAT